MFGCAASASVGSGVHAADAIERHAERLRQRRRGDAGRPQHRLGRSMTLRRSGPCTVRRGRSTPSASMPMTTEPVFTSTPSRSSALRAASRSRSGNGASTYGLPSTSTMRADSGRMRRKSWTQRLAGDFRERAGELDAGRPAADDDERQQAALPVGIRLALGGFERQQHPPPHLQRIVERLQSRRARRPLGVAEVRVRGAGREHQIVVGDGLGTIVTGPRCATGVGPSTTRRPTGSISSASASSTSTFF